MNTLIHRSRIAHFIKEQLISKYFFTNVKTSGVAVDFHLCPLMAKRDRTFYSNTCKGCYSAHIMTVYPALANKLENLPQQNDYQLELFEEDCQDLHYRFPEIKKLRFYSLGDFAPTDIPYILAASKYFQVDILSKSLTFPQHRIYLKGLINIPNVWISLSFNKDFLKFKDEILTLLMQTQANNVQMNFTANHNEDNLDAPEFKVFNVIHLKNKDKRAAADKFNTVDETRLCGIMDEKGKPVRAHGSCDVCPNCHFSTVDFLRGKQPVMVG